MSDTSSTSDLSARVKTGFPLAAGIAILLFTPALVIGLAVLAVAFIGAQELTAMLSAKSDNSDTIVILPEWLLPGTAVLMGLGSLSGESGLHGALLICVLGWIFFEFLEKELHTMLENNVRFQLIGNREGLPDFLQNRLSNALDSTVANTGLLLNLALNYGGRDEMVCAVRRIAESVKKGDLLPENIDESLVSANTYTAGQLSCRVSIC